MQDIVCINREPEVLYIGMIPFPIKPHCLPPIIFSVNKLTTASSHGNYPFKKTTHFFQTTFSTSNNFQLKTK
jgi:hypothetical protein